MKDWASFDWRLRAMLLIAALAAASSAGAWLLGIEQPTAYAAILAGATVFGLSRFSRFRRWIYRIDWRIGAIFLATAISVIATLSVYAAGLGHDPATFFGAAFAAWIGGVAFFVVVGAAVAILSLARPEEGSFDARARILFRREDGPHIDYIIARLKDMFEHYAEKTENKITILDYSESEHKYRIALDSKTSVRSYIDDITSTYRSEIEFTEITPPPPGGTPNRLVYLRIDGKAENLDGGSLSNSIKQPFTTKIERDGTSDICHRVEVWIASSAEAIDHTPIRYTQTLNLEVENHLARSEAVPVQFSVDRGKSWQDFHLAPGEVRPIPIKANIHPDSTVYEVKLLPIGPPKALDQT